jgi:hypothetical protein
MGSTKKNYLGFLHSCFLKENMMTGLRSANKRSLTKSGDWYNLYLSSSIVNWVMCNHYLLFTGLHKSKIMLSLNLHNFIDGMSLSWFVFDSGSNHNQHYITNNPTPTESFYGIGLRMNGGFVHLNWSGAVAPKNADPNKWLVDTSPRNSIRKKKCP